MPIVSNISTIAWSPNTLANPAIANWSASRIWSPHNPILTARPRAPTRAAGVPPVACWPLIRQQPFPRSNFFSFRPNEVLDPIESVGQADRVKVSHLGARVALLDDLHPGLAALLLERDLDVRVEAGPVGTQLVRHEDDVPRPVDHLEHVGEAVQLASRRSERHDPRAPGTQIPLRLDDPAGVVQPVHLLQALGICERVENLLGRRVEDPLIPQLVTHVGSPFFFSMYPSSLSSRRSQRLL